MSSTIWTPALWLPKGRQLSLDRLTSWLFAERIRRGNKRVWAGGGRTRNQDCCCDSCDLLNGCGPAGQDLYDADLELDVSGVVDSGDCSIDNCDLLNDVFLHSAPQSGGNCACINIINEVASCSFATAIKYGILITPPGCGTDVGNFYNGDSSVWRIQVGMGVGASGMETGDIFELEGAAAEAALADLCAGEDVTLPWVHSNMSCGATGATVILRAIF